MTFNTEVTDALGAERAATAWASVENLLAMADAAPSATNTVSYIPIRLDATSQGEANEELISRIRAAKVPGEPARSWSGIALDMGEGRFTAVASPFFNHEASEESRDLRSAFLLSEVHMRLGALWLNHLWRAAELAQGARDGLQCWTVLVAAACARSLLEGAA
jgi:hypothetical protein